MRRQLQPVELALPHRIHNARRGAGHTARHHLDPPRPRRRRNAHAATRSTNWKERLLLHALGSAVWDPLSHGLHRPQRAQPCSLYLSAGKSIPQGKTTGSEHKTYCEYLTNNLAASWVRHSVNYYTHSHRQQPPKTRNEKGKVKSFYARGSWQ